MAVSFAGEDHDFVKDVARKPQGHGVSVFYDQKARYAILFISRHYAEKRWSSYERKAFRVVGTDGIVEGVLAKLGSTRTETASRFDGKVPRTTDAMNLLLTERPPAWEYLPYAAVLRQGMDSLEDRSHDYLLEYAPRRDEYFDSENVYEILKNNFGALDRIINAFNRVFSEDVQERAFGRPGEAGDPDRIIHLGRRFSSVYEELLDFASKPRSMDIGDDNLRTAAQVQARWVGQPLDALRSFVDDFVREADTISARLASSEPINIEMTVVLTLDSTLTEAMVKALERYLRRR
ncbi:toll/interleukin-1 receptor domain-containing protein [Amycolatopsis sp. GM8]|uniref:toll/interleukin-1 receptor domain-containing protein n=1 Tax=Amycolatopsis sp. GM8 TaxID=2896530 RepID=UPI001F48C930|nr:toll/interleukin-1 receptor domain-containing protein [Amycolatopsis sp. GM8]